MTDTKAQIRAKKLGSTGITEDLARQFADAEGGHLVAIVDLKVEEVHKKADGSGDRRVDFTIDTIEAVVDGKLDGALVDHVRDIQAALYRNRKLAENGPELPYDDEADGPAPSVGEVLDQGKGLVEAGEDGEPVLWDGSTDGPDPDDEAYEPHDYVDEGPTEDCGICGQAAGSAVHQHDREEVDA